MQVLGEDGAVLLLNHHMHVWAWQLHGGVLQCAGTMVRGESPLGFSNSGEIPELAGRKLGLLFYPLNAFSPMRVGFSVPLSQYS